MKEFQIDLEENIKIKNKNSDLIKKNKEIEDKIKEKELKYKKIWNNDFIQKTIISMIGKIKIKNIDQKKEIEKLKEIVLKDPFLFYTSPVLTGLNKIGKINFINDIIQCLSQTKNLTKYFLIHKNSLTNNSIDLKNKEEPKLAPLYFELIQKLWSYDENGSNIYSPNNFIHMIEKINPIFKNDQNCNAKDLIIFILEQLHKELKKNININNNSNINNSKIINNINIYDKESVLSKIFMEFTKECSIISDLFFGFFEKTKICLNCIKSENSLIKNTSIIYNYELFKYIVLPLEDIKKNKINNNEINNKITIKDCFNYIQREILLNEENKIICKNCQQTNYVFNSKIYLSPNVLILVLERGNEKKNFEIEQNIDITEFVLQKDKPQLIYELYGVITKFDLNNSNSQSNAACKNPIDNK